MLTSLEGSDCVVGFVVDPGDDLELPLARPTDLEVDRLQSPTGDEGELVDCLVVTERNDGCVNRM
jgi:hypothetical protein